MAVFGGYCLSHESKVVKKNEYLPQHADLAHLVERDLAKVEVAGSSPVIRSKNEWDYEARKQ